MEKSDLGIIQTRLKREQVATLEKYCVDLFIAGHNSSTCVPLINKRCQLKFGKSITDFYCRDLFLKAKRTYLKQYQLMSTSEAQKEAVIEMENLEADIRNSVKTNNSHKFDVILSTKKHKHSLLGLDKNTVSTTINILSDVDDMFLKNLNSQPVPQSEFITEENNATKDREIEEDVREQSEGTT